MFHPYTALMDHRALRGVGRVGQATPPFEVVDGLQRFPADLATSIATNLAAMIWVPGADPRTYAAYSPGSYEVNFGVPPPAAPGFPPEALEQGAYVVANPASLAPVDAIAAGRPLDRIALAVAPDREAALAIARPGGNYVVVVAPMRAAPTTTEKKGPSTGAIVAGIAAAAVAALLLFA